MLNEKTDKSLTTLYKSPCELKEPKDISLG